MATLNWLSGAVGVAFGAVLGIVGDWQVGTRLRRWSERKALTREYRPLAGEYVNYRVTENGRHEPTGGTIKLRWDPREGLLRAAGLHANGDTEWHSDIRMSIEIKGTGSGHYHYVDSIHSGVQQDHLLKIDALLQRDGNKLYSETVHALLEVAHLGTNRFGPSTLLSPCGLAWRKA